MLLRVENEGVKCFAQRCEPQTVIDDLGVAKSYLLLVVLHLAIEGECFEFTMGEHDEGAPRGFVTATGLDADETVFDQIDTADGIAGADFIQQFDQLNGLKLHTVDRNWFAGDKADLDRLFVVWSVFRRAGHGPGAVEGRVVGIFEFAAFVADVPDIAVTRVNLLPAGGNGDAVRFGVVEAVLRGF